MEKKNILIVIDVQNDFITGALRNEDAIKSLPNIVNLIKTQRFDDTYVTMDTHDKDYLNTLEGQRLDREHCIKGTWGWEMPQEITEALKGNQNVVQVFEKPTFGSTWMSNYLQVANQNEVKGHTEYEFTIVGFCSDICVISNALMVRAHFPNAIIKVPRNCTAGVTPKSNEDALNTMQMCQIDVI